MKEESEQYDDYSEEKEEISHEAEEGAPKNKYEVAEIEFIQQEIQNITKSIEQKKLDLRICEERYTKKHDEYQKLQGKPPALSKEQKEKERSEKKKPEKTNRIEVISKPKKSAKQVMLNETAVKRQKDLKRQENEVEVLTKEINAVCLENKDLKYQIQNLRKQKNSAVTQLNDINKANDELAKEIEKLTEDNKNQS